MYFFKTPYQKETKVTTKKKDDCGVNPCYGWCYKA